MSFDASSLVGREVGDYRILSVIGEGGMGVVYEGEHPLIGKRVAIKVLHPSLTANPEVAGRFLAEARAVNAIGHRGIVDIFTFGQLPDGLTYLVMEYLRGSNFAAVIATRGAVPAFEALGWIDEVLDALSAAHAAGIVHRDIKPSNLFLVSGAQQQSYVKLLDFGVAKADFLANPEAPRTRQSVLMGTPEYMAPEQVKGLQVGAQADLYSLGVVLFELVTGRLLFPSDNPLQSLWRHATEAPPRASAVNPAVSPLVDELLLWMLQKQPSQRPASAADLRVKISAVRRHLPGSLATSESVHAVAPSSASPSPAPSAVTPNDTFRELPPVPTAAASEPAAAEEPAEARVAAIDAPTLRTPSPPGASQAWQYWLLGLAGMTFFGSTLWLAASSLPPADAQHTGGAPAADAGPAAAGGKPHVPSAAQDAALRRAASSPSRTPRRPRGPLTTVELSARLDRLDEQLQARDALRGEPDRVLNLLLARARTHVVVAETAEERLAAGRLLDELEAQLPEPPAAAGPTSPR